MGNLLKLFKNNTSICLNITIDKLFGYPSGGCLCRNVSPFRINF